MKVLHVAETAKGGVGTYLDELIVLQQAMGADGLGRENVRAIVPAQHREQLASINDESLATFDRARRSLRSLLNLRREIAKQIDEFQPDVLHLHSSFSGLVGRTLRQAHRTRAVVYQPHGWAFEMWTNGWKRGLFIIAERALTPLCDRVVVVSEAERGQASAAGLPAARLRLVLNGVADNDHAAKKSPWPGDQRKILFIGRLDRQKGVDTLMRIATRNLDGMQVRVIGAGVAGDQVLQSVPANVECLGWLDRRTLTSHIEACDVLAMPSRWEAFGLTAVEAMRSAKPVVAYDVGGLREVVVDGETGILVRADDEDAFEAALLRTSNEVFMKMGKAGRARFKALFTSRRMAEGILEVYRDVSGSGHR